MVRSSFISFSQVDHAQYGLAGQRPGKNAGCPIDSLANGVQLVEGLRGNAALATSLTADLYRP
jgi:hypothetical protein